MVSGPIEDIIIARVKPEPGETVVVTVPELFGGDWAEAVGEQLKRAFPDNRCVVMEEGTSLSVEDDQLRDLLSSCKQWRQATESRLRLVTNREMSDSLLAPDKALFDAIDKATKSDHLEEGAR